MRKLMIVAMLLPLTAGGCREPLRRIEVWKQQTFFSPSESQLAPGPQFVGPANTPAPWATAYPPAAASEAIEWSPEEINGVLEQP